MFLFFLYGEELQHSTIQLPSNIILNIISREYITAFDVAQTISKMYFHNYGKLICSTGECTEIDEIEAFVEDSRTVRRSECVFPEDLESLRYFLFLTLSVDDHIYVYVFREIAMDLHKICLKPLRTDDKVLNGIIRIYQLLIPSSLHLSSK